MVSFQTTDDPGVEIVDPIERRRVAVRTDAPVDPTPVDTGSVAGPVDASIAVTTATVTIEQATETFVRDETGAAVAAVRPTDERAFPGGTYEIESDAAVKLYLLTGGPLTVAADHERVRVSLSESRRVVLGARSYHERPAGTVTTTAVPEDVFDAVSLLGSALKTSDCERSFPTLRGHPPKLELGEAFDAPAAVERPDTGVRIELPPVRRSAFVAAPLAYYLGAELVPGDDARLVTDEGFEHSLDDGGSVEDGVARALRQTFSLDCITRTEGRYQVALAEREAAEARAAVDLDFAALYDAPLTEQLAAYLSVPYDAVADLVPRWRLTARVEPSPDRIAALPFLADQLAVVRSPAGETVSESDARQRLAREYLGDETDRAATGPDPIDPGKDAFVATPDASSIEQQWLADGVPVDATKATPTAFANGLDRSPNAGEIEIVLVCNDVGAAEGFDAVTEGYGDRDSLPFSVTFRHDVTTAELDEILRSDVEFFHYVGHVDDGLRCMDGTLDVRERQSIGADAFLLNACRSYEQGMAMLDAGSRAGIVTVADVATRGAGAVGRAVARLLNAGFTVKAALDVASGESLVGGQYIVVGDGTCDVVQNEENVPALPTIRRAGREYDVAVHSYLSGDAAMGTAVFPHVPGNDRHYLAPGEVGRFRLSPAELRTYLRRVTGPVRLDGDLVWADEDSVSGPADRRQTDRHEDHR